MQTLYYTTHNFVRRSGNVIDLCEYRSRMQDVQEEPEEEKADFGALSAERTTCLPWLVSLLNI